MSTDTTPAVLNAGLPLRPGKTPTAAVRGDTTPQQQLAWQREMERAQMTGWFRPGTAGARGAAAAPADRPVGDRARDRGMGDRHGGATRMRQADLRGVEGPSAAPTTDAPVANSVSRGTDARAHATRAAVALSMQAATVVGDESAAANGPRVGVLAPHRWWVQAGTPPTMDALALPEDATDAASDTFQADPPEQLAPLRLHEEARAEGQAVWIAMRADDEALAAMLPRLVTDLQQGLLQRGQRLHQVVCNGRLVWRDGTPVPPDDLSISHPDERRAISGSIDFKEA